MQDYNLPPGCTQAMIDARFGGVALSADGEERLAMLEAWLDLIKKRLAQAETDAAEMQVAAKALRDNKVTEEGVGHFTDLVTNLQAEAAAIQEQIDGIEDWDNDHAQNAADDRGDFLYEQARDRRMFAEYHA